MITAAGLRGRLAAANVTLPLPARPIGGYAAAVERAGLVALSGQFPRDGTGITHTGRIGAELTLAQGVAAARQAGLNVLAQVLSLLDNGDRIRLGLLRIDGYLAVAPDFTAHATVLDGASAVLVDLLGAEAGRHARVAVGVARLPLDAPVELAATLWLDRRG